MVAGINIKKRETLVSELGEPRNEDFIIQESLVETLAEMPEVCYSFVK